MPGRKPDVASVEDEGDIDTVETKGPDLAKRGTRIAIAEPPTPGFCDGVREAPYPLVTFGPLPVRRPVVLTDGNGVIGRKIEVRIDGGSRRTGSNARVPALD